MSTDAPGDLSRERTGSAVAVDPAGNEGGQKSQGLLLPLVVILLVVVTGGIYGAARLITKIRESVSGKAKADIHVVETSLIRYRTLTGAMPSTLEDLVRRPASATGSWRQLIKESALKDPWNQDYQYRNPGIHNPTGYDLYSTGIDMKDGTPDDIGNW